MMSSPSSKNTSEMPMSNDNEKPIIIDYNKLTKKQRKRLKKRLKNKKFKKILYNNKTNNENNTELKRYIQNQIPNDYKTICANVKAQQSKWNFTEIYFF